ncbi:hypothetical protein LCGC14_1710140, partial [marine sediment metagenome]
MKLDLIMLPEKIYMIKRIVLGIL